MINIGICGYGNLGRGIEKAVKIAPDMKLIGVFTRRDPKTVVLASDVQAYHIDDLKEISELLAENSPRYIMICFADESKMYFEYEEGFCGVFSVINQHKPHEQRSDNEYVSPYALQKTSDVNLNTCSSDLQRPIIQRPTSTNNVQKKKDSLLTKLIIALVCFVAFVGIVAYGVSQPDNDVVVPPNITTTENYLIPKTQPLNGEILSGYDDYNGSEITIKSSSNEAYVVKLKDVYNDEIMSFYVRAGATVTIGVPAEEMYVYFASGNVWYGMDDLFGDSTSYSMDDELKDFENYTYEYTLYTVSNGNFSETPIDAEDF